VGSPDSEIRRNRSFPGQGMKICHVATVDLSIRFLIQNLLIYNKQRGWDVHAAASPGEHVPVIEGKGISFHPVPFSRRMTPFSDLISLIRLISIFRREKFDAVHVHTPKGASIGSLAAFITRIPARFYTIHGYYFHPDMPAYKARFYRFFEFLTSRFVHHAFTVNREDRVTALRLGYYPEERITYLGGGIDLSQFVPSGISSFRREEIRRSIGFVSGDRVVGFIGRLVREKGLVELLEAYRSLKERLPKLRLLIVGPMDPEKKDAISPSIANDLGVEDAVFTGIRLDIPDLLSVMDVFALPSYREGFPQSVMEASAMGIPVVTTNVRGCREAVEDGETGIIVPARDSSSLAEAILTILSNPDLAKRMGEAGRRKALAEFDELLKFQIVRSIYLKAMGMPREV
jgi:glycosyltransferase involved in cell wall biosynthesis